MKPFVENKKVKTNTYVFAAAFVASVGGFLFGYDLTIIGGTNVFLKEQFHLSDGALGFATASATLGCISGPLLGSWLCDAISRKWTMVAASILLAISAVFTAVPQNITIFNIFRIVGGIGIGLCSVASPMYIAELAPQDKRGRLGLMWQMAIIFGAILAPTVGYFLVKSLPDTLSWRWMFASEMVAIMLFLGFLIKLPHSPRWLLEKDRFDEAKQVFTSIEDADYAKKELAEIRATLKQQSGGWAEVFAPGIRYALVIGCLLAFFNHWTGWSVFTFYIPMLLEMAGIEARANAILQFALVYGLMALETFIGILLVDKLGRRPLWIFGTIAMIIATAVAGLVLQFRLSGLYTLAVIALCTVPHGIALGPLPWLMISELFPTKIRAKAVSFTTTFLWIALFMGVQIFPIIVNVSERKIGSPAAAFWFFTFINVLAMLFGLKMLPETKNRTLEDISRSWQAHR